MAILTTSQAVFACHSAACAPPPAGAGGSCGPGGCSALVHSKVSKGILGKGRESYGTKPQFCSGKAQDKGLCGKHLKEQDDMQRTIDQRKARQTQMHEHVMSQALKQGYVGLTQREAAPFVKAGLLVRGDGKGRGAGNTPVWEPTDQARRSAHQTTDTRKVKFAGREHKVVGETDTHLRVMKPNGEVFQIPKSIAKFVN